MTEAERTFYDRTGERRPTITFDGKVVGAAQAEVLQTLVARFPNGRARSRNALRRRVLGNQSPGRIYPVIDSLIRAGLVDVEAGEGVIYPAVKITEAGMKAVIAWGKEHPSAAE